MDSLPHLADDRWIRNAQGNTLSLPFPVVGLVFTSKGPVVLGVPGVPMDFMGERLRAGVIALPWPGLADEVTAGGELQGRKVPPTGWPDWAGSAHRVEDLPEAPVFVFVVGETRTYLGTVRPGPVHSIGPSSAGRGYRKLLGRNWGTDHWVLLPRKMPAATIARVDAVLATSSRPAGRASRSCRLLPFVEMAACVRDARAVLLEDPSDDDRRSEYAASIERLLVLLAYSRGHGARETVDRYRRVLEVPHAEGLLEDVVTRVDALLTPAARRPEPPITPSRYRIHRGPR